MFESYLTNIPLNSRCINLGASTHIINSLEGIRNKKKPNMDEVSLFIGNGNEAKIEGTG